MRAVKEAIADQCAPYYTNIDKNRTDRKAAAIKAIAKLVLESKLECSASGKYAYACGETWSKADAYAGAAFEVRAARSRIAEHGDVCKCMQFAA